MTNLPPHLRRIYRAFHPHRRFPALRPLLTAAFRQMNALPMTDYQHRVLRRILYDLAVGTAQETLVQASRLPLAGSLPADAAPGAAEWARLQKLCAAVKSQLANSWSSPPDFVRPGEPPLPHTTPTVPGYDLYGYPEETPKFRPANADVAEQAKVRTLCDAVKSHMEDHQFTSLAVAPGYDRFGFPIPSAHAPDCAVALNGRHACSCGKEVANRELSSLAQSSFDRAVAKLPPAGTPSFDEAPGTFARAPFHPPRTPQDRYYVEGQQYRVRRNLAAPHAPPDMSDWSEWRDGVPERYEPGCQYEYRTRADQAAPDPRFHRSPDQVLRDLVTCAVRMPEPKVRKVPQTLRDITSELPAMTQAEVDGCDDIETRSRGAF